MLGLHLEIEPVMMAPYPDQLRRPAAGSTAAIATVRSFREDDQPVAPRLDPTGAGINLVVTVRLAGDVDAARDAYRQFSGVPGEWATTPTSGAGGRTTRVRGATPPTAGDLDTAIDHFDRAVGMADAIGSPPHAVIARLELATALTLRDGPGDAGACRDGDRRRPPRRRAGGHARLDRPPRRARRRRPAVALGIPREPWRIAIPD